MNRAPQVCLLCAGITLVALAGVWTAAGAAKPPLPGRYAVRMGIFSVSFDKVSGNLKSGEFVIPTEITGRSADGDVRSDRGFMNLNRQELTLVGHVVAHQNAKPVSGQAAEPMTLTCDQLQLYGKRKVYIATGNARAVQGARTLTADSMRYEEGTRNLFLQGSVHAQDANGGIDTSQMQYNTLSGDFTIPQALNGRSSDGDFRADRASGNQKLGTATLVGDVVVHKLGGLGRGSASKEPVTLSSDRLVIDNRAKLYTATGHAKIVQSGRSLEAPFMALDDATHVAHLKDGVHAEQPPDRSFDASEVTYNTETQDFKAYGGVRLTFPLPSPSPARSPSPAPRHRV